MVDVLAWGVGGFESAGVGEDAVPVAVAAPGGFGADVEADVVDVAAEGEGEVCGGGKGGEREVEEVVEDGDQLHFGWWFGGESVWEVWKW